MHGTRLQAPDSHRETSPNRLQLQNTFHRWAVSRPGWVALASIFLGFGWLRAATAKAIDSSWWNGGVIDEFIVEHEAKTIAWYEPVLDYIVSPFAAQWAVAILVVEVAIGLALLANVRVGVALAGAIFLNANFLLVGAANPSAFYLVLQLGLVLWLLEFRTAASVAARRLSAVALACFVIGIACGPFVRTIDPATVIEDPAAVLVTGSLCGGAASLIALQRSRPKRLINLGDAAQPGDRERV